jgi:hypothetical protein
MVSKNKLKAKIIENGLNVDEVSERVGIDSSTFYRKLNNEGNGFTINEAEIISKELALTVNEVAAIFFGLEG